MGEAKLWSRGNGTKVLGQFTAENGGATEERADESVLIEVESTRFGNHYGRADLWKEKTLAWIPHFNEPNM